MNRIDRELDTLLNSILKGGEYREDQCDGDNESRTTAAERLQTFGRKIVLTPADQKLTRRPASILAIAHARASLPETNENSEARSATGNRSRINLAKAKAARGAADAAELAKQVMLVAGACSFDELLARSSTAMVAQPRHQSE